MFHTRHVWTATLALLIFSTCIAEVSVAKPPTATDESRAVKPENYDRLRVGDSEGGRIVVPTNQVLSPLGQQIAFSARPTALAMSPDGRWLGALCNNRVVVIDLDARRVAGQTGRFDGSFTGILFTPRRQEPAVPPALRISSKSSPSMPRANCTLPARSRCRSCRKADRAAMCRPASCSIRTAKPSGPRST